MITSQHHERTQERPIFKFPVLRDQLWFVSLFNFHVVLHKDWEGEVLHHVRQSVSYRQVVRLFERLRNSVSLEEEFDKTLEDEQGDKILCLRRYSLPESVRESVEGQSELFDQVSRELCVHVQVLGILLEQLLEEQDGEHTVPTFDEFLEVLPSLALGDLCLSRVVPFAQLIQDLQSLDEQLVA